MVKPARNAKLNAAKAFSEDKGPIGFDSGPQASPPKHVTLPKMPAENELLYELQTMMLFITSMVTQYLNLYRTVWWLTQSHTNTAVNFHLIDLNAVQFSTLFVGRPFFQYLALSITSALPAVLRTTYACTASVLILIMCTYSQIISAMHIYTNHGITGILCICYPLIIYLLMYFPNILHAYETITSKSNMLKCLETLVLPTRFSTNPPVHICSANTDQIREEVDSLKSCFNERLKFILFRSLIIAYYSSFVPLCLAQPQLFYDISWTAQHVGISWLSAFLMLTSHLYSPQFYDVLHKSALHLGKWQKLEARNTLVPFNNWSDQLLYPQGVVVKYSREYYKSEGVANCAEPSNPSHLRYYIVFSNPVGGFGTLLGLLVMMVVVQMGLLIRTQEWYKVVSMSFQIVVNSLIIFRLVRSYYVLREVYKVEAQLQDAQSPRVQ